MSPRKRKKKLKRDRRPKHVRRPEDVKRRKRHVSKEIPTFESLEDVKMSDLLTEVVRPYLDSVHDAEAVERVFQLGLVAWNIALLPEAQQPQAAETILAVAENAGELQEQMEAMIARKKELFPDVQRRLVEFQLTELEDDEYYLSVTWQE